MKVLRVTIISTLFVACIAGAIIVMDSMHTVTWDGELTREVQIRVLDTRGGEPVSGVSVAIMPGNYRDLIEQYPNELARWEITDKEGKVLLDSSIKAVGVDSPFLGKRATLDMDHVIYIKDVEGLIRLIDAKACMRSEGLDFRTKSLELEVAIDEIPNQPNKSALPTADSACVFQRLL